MNRSLYATFMDVGETTEDYARMGKGISEMKESYNAEEESYQFIDEDSATNEVESYSPSFDATQRCYVGEKIFEFIDNKRKNLAVGEEAKTNCLKVYLYNQLAENIYEAAKINTTIVIGDFDAKEITYNVKQNGNQTQGYVTITTDDKNNKTVVFTAGKYAA